MMVRCVTRGWLRKRIVVQVADSGTHQIAPGTYQLHKPWRDATAADIEALARQQKYEDSLRFSDKKFPEGTRVQAISGFNVGAKGTVVFQEPAGGKVWVLRDGSGGPCYYFADELVVLEPVRGVGNEVA